MCAFMQVGCVGRQRENNNKQNRPPVSALNGGIRRAKPLWLGNFFGMLQHQTRIPPSREDPRPTLLPTAPADNRIALLRETVHHGSETAKRRRSVGHPPPAAAPPQTSRPTTEQARVEPLPRSHVICSGYVEALSPRWWIEAYKLRRTRGQWTVEGKHDSLANTTAGCWASAGPQAAAQGCAQLEQKLRKCMDVPVGVAVAWTS